MKLIKRISILVFAAFIFMKVNDFCHKQTDGFAVWKIARCKPFEMKWECEEPSENLNIREILDQPFTYFAKGGQSYVFRSLDDQYVIKFFRKKFSEEELMSFKIAAECLREETGLITTHLNPTREKYGKGKIVDRLGISHDLDFDSVPFVLQHKGELAKDYLFSLIQSGNLAKAKEEVDKLFSLAIKISKQGIYDFDPKFLENFAFYQGKPIEIDVGRFSKVKDSIDFTRMRELSSNFQAWLGGQSPELAEEFENKWTQTLVQGKTI